MHSTPHLWSASPTPLTPEFKLDVPSLERAVNWQADLGIDGLFMAGTTGEGPFLTDAVTDELTRRTVEFGRGRLGISVQVTDNSADRVMDRIRRARDAGAEMVTVAPPLFDRRLTSEWLRRYYLAVLERSPLPVCIYQLPGKTLLPAEFIPEVYAHENLRMIKDSTGDTDRQQHLFAVAKTRPGLIVLSGCEIGYYESYVCGFHGGLLGTAILNARWARAMHEAVAAGDHASARAISDHMTVFLLEIFGGKTIPCWLGGLKACLVRMGIFASDTTYFDMVPDEAVLRTIDRLIAEKFWEFDPAKLEPLPT